MKIELAQGKKVYFASDFHLGIPSKEESLVRERKIIRWLDEVSQDASHIFLVGDIFDFWYEYRKVIPRGFIRFQGKLAELVDRGIEIIFFSGNHDIWLFDYFTEELGIPVFRRVQELQINQLQVQIGHGDGLGPGDYTYKILQKIFENKVCQFFFSRIHPNFSLWLGHTWSFSRKKKQTPDMYKLVSKEKEILWHYCKQQETQKHRDFYIFGHRHIPLDLEVSEKSRYINLGEWLWSFTYAVSDGNNIELKKFTD